ncbi:MAG: transcriptional regulator [Xanthomonadales bacterium]|nr:transcriptional regulator [Xanthomonadales bacterium]
MMTVIETPMFLRYAAEVWSDDERTEFVDFIAAEPDAGDVVPGAAPLRKVRWSRRGMGKRGGVRVIYFLAPSEGTICLLLVYSKSKIDNLSPAFLRALRKLME